MTYQQKLNANDDNTDADEASALFLTVADASSSSSSSLGQDDWVATKKNHGVRMIVVVAICILLGTMVVIHGGSGSGRSNIRAPDDTTMLNQDMMAVGVQEDEQVEGKGCCPEKDRWAEWKHGKLCPDDIYDHHTQWFLGGCVRSSCFACEDGSHCCLKNESNGGFDEGFDFSCPNCSTSF